MDDSFMAAVKQAFCEANIGRDCEFDYTPGNRFPGTVKIAQCIVSYKSGNEYFRVDTLIDAVRRFGDIDLVEFRGRGVNDAGQLLIEMTIDGIAHQIIYLLPPN